MKEQVEVLVEDRVLPVLREELTVEIQKRVTGIVRLEKKVREYEHAVNETLESSTLSVEHIPINRYLDHPAQIRQEGDTTIFPVMEEIAIVTKQLVLKEEIRVTRLKQQSRYQETVPLMAEEVFVERIAPNGSSR